MPIRSRLISLRDGLAATRLATTVFHRLDHTTEPNPWQALRQVVAGTLSGASVDLASLSAAAIQAELACYVAARHPAAATHLKGAVARAQRHHALLELAGAQLHRTLESHELAGRVALLKGSASGRLAYPHPGQRQRRDLDLLLLPEDFPSLRAALWNAGWRDAPNRERGGPPFSGRTFGMRLNVGAATISLDLHRDLVSPVWCGLTGAGFRRSFLSRAVPQPDGLPITGLHDTLAHTVAHIVHAGFRVPMKVFVDMMLLLKSMDPTEYVQNACGYGLRTATWACAGVLERWFDTDMSDLRDATRPSRPKGRLIDSLLSCGGPYAISPEIPRWRAVHGFPVLLTD